jgi:hypothetical protein
MQTFTRALTLGELGKPRQAEPWAVAQPGTMGAHIGEFPVNRHSQRFCFVSGHDFSRALIQSKILPAIFRLALEFYR